VEGKWGKLPSGSDSSTSRIEGFPAKIHFKNLSLGPVKMAPKGQASMHARRPCFFLIQTTSGRSPPLSIAWPEPGKPQTGGILAVTQIMG